MVNGLCLMTHAKKALNYADGLSRCQTTALLKTTTINSQIINLQPSTINLQPLKSPDYFKIQQSRG
jgi:hypothetical protein